MGWLFSYSARTPSLVFPGLWLDPAAMVRSDHAGILKALERGLRSPDHRTFVGRLARRGRSR